MGAVLQGGALSPWQLVTCVVALIACWHALVTRPNGLSSPRKGKLYASYFIPTKTIDFLAHVMSSFDRAGYELMRKSNLTDGWDVMWTYHNPFYNRDPNVNLPPMMKNLKPNQKVNQLPGASFFTSKVELAKESRNLTLVPRSFVLPHQYSEFLEHHEGSPKGTTWVKKGTKHRGVSVIDPYDESLKEGDQEAFIQQFVRPYLIDGHSWDMGIYVAITSVSPLRAYYYDNVLLRFCSLEFNENLEDAHRDSYVVEDDYIPPWGMKSLRDYYSWGLSTLNVLRGHFAGKGLDVDLMLNQALHAINDLLVHFEPVLERASLRYPHGQKSFFSIYRVDFLVDRQFRPWIMEVNQSPNLSSAHTRDLASMFEQISYSLLSLNGFLPGGIHHPGTSQDDLDIIVHNNDVDIAYDVCSACIQDCEASSRCFLCRRCRTPSQTRFIGEMISEHRNRQGFIRLHPMSERMDPDSTAAKAKGANNELQREWINLKCRHDYTWC